RVRYCQALPRRAAEAHGNRDRAKGERQALAGEVRAEGVPPSGFPAERRKRMGIETEPRASAKRSLARCAPKACHPRVRNSQSLPRGAAEAHGNRTHLRRRATPYTGFEDREPRQLAARFQNPGCHTLPRKRRGIETEANAGAKR